MADTAAHLVDRVLPEVPVRQWVLSLPWQLRYRLAYDAPLVQEVLSLFVRAVFASLRRRALDHRRTRGVSTSGAVKLRRLPRQSRGDTRMGLAIGPKARLVPPTRASRVYSEKVTSRETRTYSEISNRRLRTPGIAA
jgi:hypothetical protein